MELAEYGRAIVRGWWVLVLCVLAGLGSAALATAAATPSYQSSVKFFVVSPPAAGQSALQSRELSKQRILAYPGLVKSDKFVEGLVRNGTTGLSAAAITESISASADKDTLMLTVVVSLPDRAKAVDTARAVAGSLGAAVGELEAGRTETGAGQTVLKVVAGPTDETAPVSPRPTLNLALGGLLGLGAGIAIAVSRRLLDKTLRTVADVEAAAGLPLLAGLPVPAPAAGSAGQAPKGSPARRRESASALGEAVRRLRTNIDHFPAMPASGVVAVTSATAGEGKSSAALLLARSWAEAGVSVLLVEADLRSPRLAGELGLGGGLGLADVLAGRAALGKAIAQTDGNGPHILAAGTVPAAPTELLAGRSTATVLGQLRDTYSRVIIDAPAMQPFSDAALLAASADCTVLVLRRGRVTRELLASSLRNLELVGARLAGVVLTDLPLRRPGRFTARSGRPPAPAQAAAVAPAAEAPAGVPAGPRVKHAAARQ
ncbi:polysaccharide biosynthesis tyrosine autokinase [Pseudarthrobacter sp. H2]|uniref:polysaccharide biosynthesis tyrosine autokinase n=1 Tax=Pseudarthrobacter sp. H2 TaxID=3418415 RepID=UPI003CF9D2C7